MRSPGQVALKDPFIEDAVCSLIFHLKSVQVLGVGMSVDDVQLPSNELFPAIDGSVSELLCSMPVHPAAMATNDKLTSRVFFIIESAETCFAVPPGGGNHAIDIGRKSP